jgi:PIN domain nuclease of toxin-antitoxin system
MPSFAQTVVLDASALLAFAFNEPGGSAIPQALKDKSTRVVMSAVNWSEFIQKCLQNGVPVDGVLDELTAEGLRVLPVDAALADLAAQLWVGTKTKGLSLGDRMCLALGISLHAPVWTTDQAWLSVQAKIKCQVHCLR